MTFSISDTAFAATITPWLPVLDAILKSTMLLAGAGVAAALLHRASAATRHFVWTLGLLSALALPALSLAIPRYQMPLVSVSSPYSGVRHERALEQPEARRSAAPRGISNPHPEARLAASSEPSLSVTSGERQVSWQTVLLLLWAAGFVVVLGRLIVGLLAVRWISRRTEPVTEAPWLSLARTLAAEIGAGRDLTFLRSPRATMPMAWGIARSSVLMPADADAWPEERLRIVLLHELAHVKRRDCLTHALSQIVCAIYWFNPLVWIAARRLRIERERACDDLVLAAGTRGPDYADQLLEIARVMRAVRYPALLTGATLAMAHRTQLEGRLIAILDPRVPRAAVSPLRRAGATGLAICALLPLASLQPWAFTRGEQVEREGSAPAAAASLLPVPLSQPAPVPVPQPEPQRPADTLAAPVAPAPVDAEARGASRQALQHLSEALIQGIAQGVTQGIAGGRAAALSQEASSGRQSKVDPRTVAALTAALKDVDKQVREAAMHALIQLRDPSIFEPLVLALKDGSAEIREQAAVGLGQLRDERAIEPLRAALEDVEADVREQVVFALGQLRDKDSAPALAQALKDESPSVREQAAFALGQLRDRRAVPALTAAMSDASDSVREQAVFALGQLRDPAAVDALSAALRDAKSDVRQQAAFSLGQIRDARALAPLAAALKDPDADVRQQAAFALGQLRAPGAVEALVIALKDDNAGVREQVAFALGQLRDPRAIDALTAALKDSSAKVREQAAFALGQLAR